MVYKFKQRIGTRAQVMHGIAKITGGGLTKRQLKYNKYGKIVSRKASRAAKKSKNLIKAGYITKKGYFGVIRRGGMNADTGTNENTVGADTGTNENTVGADIKQKFKAGWGDLSSNSRNSHLSRIINYHENNWNKNNENNWNNAINSEFDKIIVDHIKESIYNGKLHIFKQKYIVPMINNDIYTQFIMKISNKESISIMKLMKKYEKKFYKKVQEICKNIYHKQSKIYPKIKDTFENYKDNVYYIGGHGNIIPNEYFFVPKNLSIILTTTPSYYTYINVDPSKYKSSSVNKSYLQLLLPGISYNEEVGQKNQLRFFKPGDIINNVKISFLMSFPHTNLKSIWKHKSLFNKKVSDGGIFKYFNYNKIKTTNFNYKKHIPYMYRSQALINENAHISEGNISWPEITKYNYNSTLNEIIKKFKGKEGHYVLISGTCQYGNIKTVKKSSIVYKYNEILKKKLNCFQDLSNKIDNNRRINKKRLQNFSSTIIGNRSCILELKSKLRKGKKYEILRELEEKYNNNILFNNNYIYNIIKDFKDITEYEKEHYYNFLAEQKRKERQKRQTKYL